jgi:flagellar M-ring protein FliF
MAWWDQLDRLSDNLAKLGARRLMALAAVGLSIVAAIGLGSYYLSRPSEEVLYTGLTPQDVNRIGAALKDGGIPFDVSADGTKVLVRYGQTAEARTLLAERGLPGSATSGYELFDKLGSTGLTSFMQNVTLVRALEGELARTIQTIKGVKAARVHVVLPEPGSFRRAAQPASASVVVRTEPLRGFTGAPAIQKLVAAAIPGLSMDQVTVLSTDGTILSPGGGESAIMAQGRMEDLEKDVAKDVTDNIRRTLTPYLGLDNFEVSVAAKLNTDKRQTNETTYDPESKVERSVRTVKETGSSQSTNNRWTTTVETNIPPDQTGAVPGEQSKKQNERKEDLTNFEISTKITSTINEGYKVEKLAVAVVVNRKRILASLGSPVSADAVDQQLKQIETLTSAAAGLDQKRGDKVTVAAVDFFQDGKLLEPVPPVSVIEHLLANMGSLVNATTLLAVTILLLVFGVRPLLRSLSERAAPPELSPAEAAAAALERAAEARAIGGPEAELPELDETPTPQRRLEEVIERSEEQAAAILKQWLRS